MPNTHSSPSSAKPGFRSSFRSRFKPSFRQELARWFYSGLVLIIIPISLLILLLKICTRSKTHGKRSWERYGILPVPAKSGGILLHCVSVGEVVAAEALVKTIRKQHPDTQFTITTTTPTGCERVKQLFGDEVNHFYLPLDFQFGMQQLLKRVQPEKVLITEVELWPNLIHLAWKRNIPVFIVNARMTDSSCRAYSKISSLFSPMLHKITGICAQGERDYKNYLKLGANTEQLALTNNIKFDQNLSNEEALQVEKWRQELQLQDRKILIGGSTHEPEEQLLLESYQALYKTNPNLLLILVPRHPQRFAKVESLLQKQQLHYIKLSTINLTNSHPLQASTQVILADQMGILKSLYGIADIAFVGGSIAQRGGHNALEPALHGVPVIMGEHIFNNPGICQELEKVGALQFVTNRESIISVVEPVIASPENAQKRGAAGQQVILANSGAIEKTLEILGL